MNEKYEDVFGYNHIVIKEIARGGQGIVYRTQNPNIAVKLEVDSLTNDIVKENEKYDNIRLLPIPENINLTLPQATLKNVSGYVMTLLNDMNSFEKVFDYYTNKKSTHMNKWLNSLKEENGESVNDFLNVIGQYITSGGRRTRLDAYFKCSCILSRLHENGLVYCDFSSKNAFFSNKSGNNIVWLIDADNLNFQNETINNGYYTPGYGAPELYKKKGCTFYSDSYAFAISLFWQLTWNHPFIGALADDEFEDDFVDESNEKAYSGEWPWICDKEDKTNYKESPVQQELIISNRMMEKFNETLSEIGKRKRTTRPSMFEWSYALAKELDLSVKCKYCEMDYDSLDNDKCPWCDTKNTILNIDSYLKSEMNEDSLLWRYKNEIIQKYKIDVPLRVLRGFRAKEVDTIACSIIQMDMDFFITNLNEQYDFKVKIGKNKEQNIYGNVKIPDRCTIECTNKTSNNSVWIEVYVE